MGRSLRRLAKRLRGVKQREKIVALFMSPFGPPVETRDLRDVVTIANYQERMTVADWQEAASAYRKWMVRCCEEYTPRLVERAQFRVGIDQIQEVFCRHCRFPKSDHLDEPEVLFHPLTICLFEMLEGEVARAGIFDPQVLHNELPVLTPSTAVTGLLPDFIDKSFVCPRCGFVQPLDPRLDVAGVLRVFEAGGWSSKAVGELVARSEEEEEDL